MINKIYLLFISFVLISVVALPLKAEEETQKTDTQKLESAPVLEEETISDSRWTETLRLKDFNVLPSFLELGDRREQYKVDTEKIYKIHPNVFSTAIEYGLLLIDLGEIKEAGPVWDRAIKDFVSNPTPQIYKSWVDALNGNYKAAKDVCYHHLKEKINTGINSTLWLPQHADCLIELSIIEKYLPEKDRLEATEAVNEIAKHFAKNPKFATVLITNDLQAGKLESAMKKIDRVLEKHPDEPIITTLKGITELLSGNTEQALSLLEQADKLYPYSPTNHLMRARALLALKKKKDSNRLYEQAVKIDPSLVVKGVKKKILLAEHSYILKLNTDLKDIKKDKVKETKELKETKKQDNNVL